MALQIVLIGNAHSDYHCEVQSELSEKMNKGMLRSWPASGRTPESRCRLNPFYYLGHKQIKYRTTLG